MPNWCQNNLEITGPKDQLENFRAVAHDKCQCYKDGAKQTSVLSFHAIRPVPKELLKRQYGGENLGNTIAKIDGCMNGYNWEGKYWGCKWGACRVDLDFIDGECLCYAFETAWAPPLALITYASEHWPDLVFEIGYEELGMNFAGKAVLKAGKIVKEKEWEPEPDYDDKEDDE